MEAVVLKVNETGQVCVSGMSNPTGFKRYISVKTFTLFS